jgi:hypothetical protein|tara:strand:+ start:2277 stop:2705 length:429 start_codon:yes stop_codon:yes gene_type:complete
MKLSSLNKEHEEMLKQYLAFVQGTVYSATEEYESSKFLDFNEIMENIIDYTNAFNKIVKTSHRRAEWAYMTPNLMLYACMGFLAGVKSNENEDAIENLSQDLFEKTVNFVGETSDILQDIKIKEDMQKKILTIQKENNEHNN